MAAFAYTLAAPPTAQIGMIVLQTDETLEGDFRRLIPPQVDWFVSRVPAAEDLSSDSLQDIENHLSRAASLLPRGAQFDAVGYGCTSGTAQVGAARIATQVRAGVTTPEVSEPVSALIAACHALGVRRLALLSPYVAQVSDRLRETLALSGIQTPVFGSFEEPSEAAVVRISESSTKAAAQTLVAQARTDAVAIDAVFLSCTNLHTLGVIPALQDELGLPVLSSNLVLAWHLMMLAAPGLAPAQPLGLLTQSRAGMPQ